MKDIGTCIMNPDIYNFLIKLNYKINNKNRKSKMNLNKLQKEQNVWCLKNFPYQKPYQNILGVIEEVGELAHAHLKKEQGIRTNEDHDAMKQDAIGDIIIYLAGYCNACEIDLEDCVTNAWKEVKKRDWIKNKELR